MMYAQDMKWKEDSEYKSIPTVFYQGMNSSQTQLARYVGSKGFIATTNELVRFKQSENVLSQPLDIISQPFVGIEIHDVNLNPFKDFISYFNPLKLVMSAMTYISNWWYGIEVTGSSDNVTTVKFHSIEFKQVSIAQKNDISSHKDKVDLLNNEPEINLHGVSRGAATTFNALAAHKYKNVKLVTLEGCPSSIPDVLERRYGFFAPAVKFFLGVFTAYRDDDKTPLDNVDNIPADIPIAFITSKTDKEVPFENTKKLAEALANRGQNPVYMLVLDQSSHNGYISDNLEDRTKYQNFMHALYKKYGLSHIEEFAEEGKSILNDSELSSKSELVVLSQKMCK